MTRSSILLIWVFSALALGVAWKGTVPMGIATVAYGLILTGALWKGKRSIHGMLTGTGILFDLLLVVYLQSTRDAISVATSFELNPLQQSHVAASIVAVLLYVPAVGLGLKRYSQPHAANTGTGHKRMGKAAFMFRSAGFLLMFSLLGRIN